VPATAMLASTAPANACFIIETLPYPILTGGSWFAATPAHFRLGRNSRGEQMHIYDKDVTV